jgi:tetrahydromethanopterin S-methyltransferase subunit B
MIAGFRESAFFGIMPGVVLVGVIVVILAILYFVRR